jgi:hypothetical protein
MLTLLPKGVKKSKKISDWRFFPFAAGVNGGAP